MEQNKEIELLRGKIDYCDESILFSLNDRFSHVKKIGEIKKKNNIPIVDEDRFKKMINDRLALRNTYIADCLSEDFIRKLFDLIHEESCKIQKEK
jgi:chorismate mutase